MFKKTDRSSEKWTAWGAPLLWGTLVGAVCVLLFLLSAAALCVAIDIPTGLISPMAFVACAVGAAVGGLVAGKISRRRGWLFGLLCGLLVYLLIACVGALCIGRAVGTHAPLSLLLCIACGAVGGIIGVNLKSRKFSV